jgi:secreted trypsin-like serine protease
MHRWAALAGCFLCLAACADVPTEAPRLGGSGEAILRGHPAAANEQWGTVGLLVSLGQDEWLCTGTLIAPQLVVTAGHCVKDEYSDELATSVLVIAGAADIDNAEAGQVYEAARFVAHPRALHGDETDDPTGLGADYDIAIVQTKSKVTQVTPVQVPAMATLDAVLPEGAELVIAGYGTRVIDEKTGLSDQDGEHYVGLQHFVRRSQSEFLAGSSTDADTCPGDSGGPAYLMVNGEPLLVGATSRGRYDFPKVDCGEGGIYTLVPAFKDWIDEAAMEGATGDGDTGDGDSGDGDSGDGDEQSDAGASGDGDDHGDGDGDSERDAGSAGYRHKKSDGCSLGQDGSTRVSSLLSLMMLGLLLRYRRAKAGQTMSK